MNLTAAEKKAGYEDIKQYVLEKFGLKVSHLYIANGNMGLLSEKNRPKSENARPP